MLDLLSGLTRRRLLIGLAAASTAAAAPAAVAGAAVATPTENPELIRLGDLLDGVAAEVDAARAHKQTVINHWWKSWPKAPDAICDGYVQTTGYHAAEKGLTGTVIRADGSPVPPHRNTNTAAEWLAYVDEKRTNPAVHCPRYVQTAKDFAWRREQCLKALRRKRSKHPLPPLEVARLELEAGLYGDKEALAADYEAACKRVLAASGYREAIARDKAAYDALATLVGAIIEQPAETMAGIIIKAQALTAWNAEPTRMLHVEGWGWPGAFAAEVLRIADMAA
jgi:hypothetical protein